MKRNRLILVLSMLLFGSAAMAQEGDTIQTGGSKQNPERRNDPQLEGQNTDRYRLNDQSQQQRRSMDDGEPTGVTRPTRQMGEDSGYSADTTESSTGAQYQDAPQSSGDDSGLEGSAAGTSEVKSTTDTTSNLKSSRQKRPDR